MPERESPEGSNVSGRVFWNALGLAWLSANVWAYWPLHRHNMLTTGMMIGVIVVDLILFFVMGWMWGLHRRFSVIVWPILVIVAWFHTPAFGAWVLWDYETFRTILLRPHSRSSWAYVASHTAFYFLGACLARRRATRLRGGKAAMDTSDQRNGGSPG